MAPSLRIRVLATRFVLAALILASASACDSGPLVTPAITPGTPADPREVIIVARDYAFTPAVIDLVPGETVLIQLVDGGLIAHEAVFGPSAVQDAWEAAQAPLSSAPPGSSPQVSIAPELGGLRIVVASGERKDVTWVVPAGAAADAGGWFVGCHIPGHWAEGMVVPVRFVGPDGRPLPSLDAGTGDNLRGLAAASSSAAPR
jgi:uncharacterized cupredoxin-like copper-binding protein